MRYKCYKAKNCISCTFRPTPKEVTCKDERHSGGVIKGIMAAEDKATRKKVHTKLIAAAIVRRENKILKEQAEEEKIREKIKHGN